MNSDETTPTSSRSGLADAALLFVAVAAIAAWLWRRVRNRAPVDAFPVEPVSGELADRVDDAVGAATGFPGAENG